MTFWATGLTDGENNRTKKPSAISLDSVGSEPFKEIPGSISPGIPLSANKKGVAREMSNGNGMQWCAMVCKGVDNW